VAGESAESWLITRYRVRIGFIVFYAALALICVVFAFADNRPGLLIGALLMGVFLVINLKWLRDIKRDLARTREASGT
jgi:hypothetical protein